MKKERNIQIEVVRILAMFMIILGHAVLYGHAAESIKIMGGYGQLHLKHLLLQGQMFLF
ncbi:hypothetical protein NBH08_11720 [Faecalicatena sp. BF-R-105]|jgi:hypothetical protein|nr:hypothetical protein [Faecalicatena sp. BF-R-105]